MKGIIFLVVVSLLAIVASRPEGPTREAASKWVRSILPDTVEGRRNFAEKFQVAKHIERFLRSLAAGEARSPQPGPFVEIELPTLEDPILLPDPTDITIPPELGSGSINLNKAIVTGLSNTSLVHKLEYFIALPARVNYIGDIAGVSFEGESYTADVALDLAQLGIDYGFNITGNGKFHAKLGGISARLGFLLTLRGLGVKLYGLSAEIGFQNVDVNFENLAIDGAPIDWVDFNAQFKVIFDTLWPQIRDEALPVVEKMLDEIVAGCTIAQLIGIIDGGDASCLSAPTLPTVPPTTTAGPVPSDEPTDAPAPTDAPTNAPTASTTPAGVARIISLPATALTAISVLLVFFRF